MVFSNIPAPVSTREYQSYVTILTTPFARIVASIADRLAELLCTNVWVLDEQHGVLASKLPFGLGGDFDPSDPIGHVHGLHVPFKLNEEAGTVVIGA
ncbi:MAG TPA: hypothetical protein VFU22_32340, partial [Roseiflexaceae bacterium]|nr:hypothetical protein [Roseiflexaceae bacterium]